MNIVKRILEIQRKKNIANFDKSKYIMQIYKMFIGADLANGGSVDLTEILKKLGDYNHDKKFNVDKIKFYSDKLIDDINAQCSEDFTCNFGDLVDEIDVLITEHLKKRLKVIEKN